MEGLYQKESRDKQLRDVWRGCTRRRVEMKQLRDVWRSCTRDNMEAGESYFVLNPAADW